MSQDTTDIGGPSGRFPSTQASAIDPHGASRILQNRARSERLVRLYWKPVYCVIRQKWAKSNDDAKDLTQEFFTQEILEGSLLENYAPQRGGFRAFLKGAIFNFMTHAQRADGSQKRGGHVKLLSLEAGDLSIAEIVPNGNDLTPEQLFDRAWKREVLAQAIVLLEERLRAQGKEEYFQAFKRYDLDPSGQGASYKAVADSLGISQDTLKNHLVRARKEFMEAVSGIVFGYLERPSDLSMELKELFGP